MWPCECGQLIPTGDSALTGLPRMAEVEVSDVRKSDHLISTQAVAVYALADGLLAPRRAFSGPRGVCLSPSGCRLAVMRRMIGDLNMDDGSSRPAAGGSTLAAGTPMGNNRVQFQTTVIVRDRGAAAP
jgi:hypothetical protein